MESFFGTFSLVSEKDIKEIGKIFKDKNVIKWELFSITKLMEDQERQEMCIAMEWKNEK